MSLQDPQPGEQAAIVISSVWRGGPDCAILYLDSPTLADSKCTWAECHDTFRQFTPGQVIIVEWQHWPRNEPNHKPCWSWLPIKEDEDGQAGTS